MPIKIEYIVIGKLATLFLKITRQKRRDKKREDKSVEKKRRG